MVLIIDLLFQSHTRVEDLTVDANSGSRKINAGQPGQCSVRYSLQCGPTTR